MNGPPTNAPSVIETRGLPLDHHRSSSPGVGVRMGVAELLDRRRGSRPEALERPESKVLRHVLRISPENAEHRRRLEDGVLFGVA